MVSDNIAFCLFFWQYWGSNTGHLVFNSYMTFISSCVILIAQQKQELNYTSVCLN
jgi:hypothetical protein